MNVIFSGIYIVAYLLVTLYLFFIITNKMVEKKKTLEFIPGIMLANVMIMLVAFFLSGYVDRNITSVITAIALFFIAMEVVNKK